MTLFMVGRPGLNKKKSEDPVLGGGGARGLRHTIQEVLG
jgi:hypothetical protein